MGYSLSAGDSIGTIGSPGCSAHISRSGVLHGWLQTGDVMPTAGRREPFTEIEIIEGPAARHGRGEWCPSARQCPLLADSGSA